MATVAQPISGTEIFARRNLKIPTTYGHRAAIFSPREQRIGEVINVRFDEDLPAWADAVLNSLSMRWGVRAGWDGYGAKPTNPNLVVVLLNLLSVLMKGDFKPPDVMPLADGGVQAEWHANGQDLEIVVPATAEPSYYYFDEASGEEEEASLSPNHPRVQSLIARMS